MKTVLKHAWKAGGLSLQAALAARAALRVAPLLVEALHEDATARRAGIVLPTFRLLAAVNFVSAWPMRVADIREAVQSTARLAGYAILAAENSIQSSIVEYREISDVLPLGKVEKIEADARALSLTGNVVDASVHAVMAVLETVDAANGIASPDAAVESAVEAVRTAIRAVDGAHGYPALRASLLGDSDDATGDAAHIADFMKALERDAELLETGKGAGNELAAGLSGRALWPDGMSIWAGRKWVDLKYKLSHDEGWHVWIDWYEARLTGRSSNEALEFARVTIPEEDWEQGPAHVNAIIVKMIEAQPDPLVAALTQSLEEVDAVRQLIDLSQYTSQIRNALPDDTPRALGVTKDMLEATMKTILDRRGVAGLNNFKFPKLTDRCFTELGLKGESAPVSNAERHLRKIASNARRMIEAANELRNCAGTGHGRVVGEELPFTVADANLVASTGMVLAAWLTRRDGGSQVLAKAFS